MVRSNTQRIPWRYRDCKGKKSVVKLFGNEDENPKCLVVIHPINRRQNNIHFPYRLDLSSREKLDLVRLVRIVYQVGLTSAKEMVDSGTLYEIPQTDGGAELIRILSR